MIVTVQLYYLLHIPCQINVLFGTNCNLSDKFVCNGSNTNTCSAPPSKTHHIIINGTQANSDKSA